MQSIYDVARNNPDKWLRRVDCENDDHICDLAETGGMLQWCSCCDTFNSPNRPCFCGCLIIQREDGLFWGGENGWTEDWKFNAEHFFSLDSIYDVASVLHNDNGVLSIYAIQKGWQNKKPNLEVG